MHTAALSDLKLALRCSELLVESLVTFSGSPGLQKWCSYGLLQLSSQHRRVKEMVQQSNCLSRVDPATEEDKPYVDQLKETIIGSK